MGYLGNSPTPYRELTRLLTVPNLPAKTADNVLALLLQSRQLAAAKAVDIQGLLVESLHTDNSDIRARIQNYLAKEKGIPVPQNLLDWQSDPKDTTTSVDQIIRPWRQVK